MGKNIHFLIIFIVGVCFYNNFAFAVHPNDVAVAVGVPSQKNDVTNIKDGKAINCTIKFNELDYVGMKFDGEALCVYAPNAGKAVATCALYGYQRIINPANPQYTQDPPAGANISTNPDNYYYCVRNLPANIKYEACINSAPKISDYLSKNANILFTWERTSPKDGNCRCGSKDEPKVLKDCYQEIAEFPSLCQEMGLSEAKWEELTEDQQCSAFPTCKCADGRSFLSNIAKDKCAEEKIRVSAVVPPPPIAGEVPPPSPIVVEAPTPIPTPTAVEVELTSCIDSWENQAKECEKKADKAAISCKAVDKKLAKENKDTAGAIDAASNMHTNMKAGSGAQQQCFLASLAANVAKDSLSAITDSCKSDRKSCSNACSQETLANLQKSCQDKISPEEVMGPHLPSAVAARAAQIALNQNYFDTNEKEIKEIYADGQEVCSAEAGKGELKLSELLSSVGKSLHSSVMCMCQLSSSGPNVSDECKSIPSPNDCNLIPSGPGCGVYGSLDVCTPGVAYDAKLCNCQLNPKTAGCPGHLSGGLTTFAGTQINSKGAADSGGGNIIAGGPKSSGGDMDVPIGSDEAGSDLKYQGPVGDAGAGPSGGSPGGMGGGPSSGGPAEAQAVAPEEKGIGGLFNQAKSIMSNAFGLKKSPPTNPSIKDAKKSSAIDANKFRPMRGVASKSGFGTKNQDIWIMMNKCIIAETCRNNNNSFLDSALKHK